MPNLDGGRHSLPLAPLQDDIAGHVREEHRADGQGRSVRTLVCTIEGCLMKGCSPFVVDGLPDGALEP
jgi:hypothetical protein